MANLLFWGIILFAILGALSFLLGIWNLRKKHLFGSTVSLLLALFFLSLAALAGTMAVATQGYRAFSHEEIAARIGIEPIEKQVFRAQIHFPDGRVASFRLAGDEIYLDAHILKWKPIANLIGMHTAYELDRISGRYTKLEDEQAKPRTVFSLSKDKAIDIFDLRKRFFFLRPLLDAEYGSATFIPTASGVELEVRVSISGLLIRKRKEKG